MRNDKEYQLFARILGEELVCATGCTEPIAIAFCAAKLRETLGAVPERIEARVSGSILKNAKSVVVPNCGGMKGIRTAVAAGIVAGDSAKKLEVIADVSEEQQAAIRHYAETAAIGVTYLESGCELDIVMEARSGDDDAKLRVAVHHTNLVHLEKNGEVLVDLPVCGDEESGLTDRGFMTMAKIFDYADNCDLGDVRGLLDRQIACNMAIAEEGMRGGCGANIGLVAREAFGGDVRSRACAYAAAGSDARMSGCELPVVINSGSGNQGIACSVPVIVYARELGSSDEKLYRALLLSNLTAIYQKNGIGRLSAFCGAVCAGAAAGVGISYLLGGGFEVAAHTLVNGLAIISGTVCDGAKPSCAAKIFFSVHAGILGYEMYLRGQQFYAGEGLIAKGVDHTIRNIGILGKEGMKATNDEIIKIMIGREADTLGATRNR